MAKLDTRAMLEVRTLLDDRISLDNGMLLSPRTTLGVELSEVSRTPVKAIMLLDAPILLDGPALEGIVLVRMMIFVAPIVLVTKLETKALLEAILLVAEKRSIDTRPVLDMPGLLDASTPALLEGVAAPLMGLVGKTTSTTLESTFDTS